MRQKEPLCQQYDPFREHPLIYSKVFLPGKIHFSLRPFHIAHDLTMINDWLNFQFAHINGPVRDPFQYTEDYYTTLLATPNSQPLMGMIDQKPAFQTDIYEAQLGPDKLLDNVALNVNDFIIQLMLSPDTLQNLSLSTAALLACLDCFLNYPEVNRIVWMTNAGEKMFRFIAGIAELDEMECEDSLQSYYIITKEKFNQVQYSLPFVPEGQHIAADY
jgi:hypothetical protein